MSKEILAFDKATVRSVDDNGYLHVEKSHISKAQVAPYYGREIPGWQERGLEPDKIYHGWRSPEELEKSVSTWEGLPLQVEHHVDSAVEPQKAHRVGTVGMPAAWSEPYLDAPLVVWDQAAIDHINDGTIRELSCCYWYEPVFEAGIVDAQPFDFKMTKIRGNHVALVESGRAGHDVLVADSLPKEMTKKEAAMGLKNLFKGAKDDAGVEQQEVDLAQAIIDLHRVNPLTGEVVDIAEDESYVEQLKELSAEMREKLPEEELEKFSKVLLDMASRKLAGDETEGEQKAFAEGVKYGEEVEKAEPKKLDSEHESEGLKKAEDACGQDTNAGLLDEIVKLVPGLTVEQIEKIRVIFETSAPIVEVAEPVDVEAAADKALAKRKVLTASDADSIRAQATADAMARMRSVSEACRKVRPLVGEMDAMAFDSAEAVYKNALEQSGVQAGAYDPKAYAGMVDMLIREAASLKAMPFAADSKPIPETGPFAHLSKIYVAE